MKLLKSAFKSPTTLLLCCLTIQDLAPHRMGLLVPLVLCTLAACCGARSPPQRPYPLLSRGCNDSDVVAMAGFALEDINKDRKDGYVLTLNRVTDAWEYRENRPGSLFYLTLDVLDTYCHVLSKKSWKECELRSLHNRVYGQCKAMFYASKPRRILHLLAYNCTTRPVSRRKIHSMCPDCPTSVDLSSQKVREAATESLEKYNRESPSKQYALVKVTSAFTQWMHRGPSYFVEYLIHEACPKSHVCTLEISDSPPVALCKGSTIEGGLEKLVSVNCDFFDSKDPDLNRVAFAMNQEPEGFTTMEKSPQTGRVPPTSSPEAMPKGSIQCLPELDDERPEGSQESPQEAFPVQLDLTTNPLGEALDISFLFMGPVEEKLFVLPFPKRLQHHTECPGPAKDLNPLIIPP